MADVSGVNSRVPAVDLIRRRATQSRYGMRRPEGDVVLMWTAPGAAEPTVLEVTEWTRLDDIPKGTRVQVLVQGREVLRVDQPMMGARATVVTTGDPVDELVLVVGDDRTDEGWQFGAVLTGVRDAAGHHQRSVRRRAPA